MRVIVDAAARAQALDPRVSFIVEAPAGSGKTELLVQRYLRLLSIAAQPEEVLAITFTVKAAHEMRTRVLTALMQAQNPVSQPSQTILLAAQVLARDQEHNWQLLGNPNRLWIQTIDALCMHLANQLPITSGFGGNGEIAEIPDEIYQKSIAGMLETLDDNTTWQNALIHLLTHFDNQYAEIEKTLIDMLKKRDQWLPYMMAGNDPQILRAQFELYLSQINQDALKQLDSAFHPDLKEAMLPLMRYAADNVDADSVLKVFTDINEFPSAQIKDLPIWQGLIELFLTQANTFRKQVNKNTGFPPAKNEYKAQIQEILTALADNETLLTALCALRAAPPLHYSAQAWEFMQSLFTLLPVMIAQLIVNFQQQGQVDFIEVAGRALMALGDEDAPTDLALVLDHQLRHILIDEFQDTSITQFRLLEKMVAGWEHNDGRTLFVVGDPQQSIYRFRQAKVGLFLQAKYYGVGHLSLTPIQLQMNFRSDPQLIAWINELMPKVMPEVADMSTSAIAFTPCIAARDEQSADVKCWLMPDESSEAIQIAQQISLLKAENPNVRIAILVRARSHLSAIMPELKAANIAYQAIDIEPLLSRTCIHDLMALTRALLHFHDRIAWLALLRSPVCGLNLAELEIIAQINVNASIWENMQESQLSAKLSSDALLRLNRVIQALKPTLAARARMSLAQWVRSAWIALGGAHYALSADTQDIEDFFKFLQRVLVDDAAKIEEYLATLYTNAPCADPFAVQIMTIHKAKGLEFDAVFLPQLSRKGAQNKPPLLRYMQQTAETGGRWLLAPIHAKTAQVDPIYQYLGYQERQQETYEMQRVLYVALTRAKQYLYLSAVCEEETLSAKPGSLLALIWPAFNQQVEFFQTKEPFIAQKNVALQRLPSDWQLPEPWHQWLHIEQETLVSDNSVDLSIYQPENIMRRHVGTLLHRILRYLAQEQILDFPITENILSHWRMQLRGLGVQENQIAAGLDLLSQGITRMLQDEKGRWILQAHEQSACEYVLQSYQYQQYQRLIVDRTFIENDTRWIIDYKSSQPQGHESLDEFLDREIETYRAQLERYALIMRAIEDKPIRLALYYPLIPAWRVINESIKTSSGRCDILARTV